MYGLTAGIGAPQFGTISNVVYRNITSINTSAAIRIAALAEQRGAVTNISFEDFTLIGVRGNAIDIDAYGQGSRSGLHVVSTAAPPPPPPHAIPCATGSTPKAPAVGSCMLIDGMRISSVHGDADKAGMILCGSQCTNLLLEHVHIQANASACCAKVARGELPPGTCYWGCWWSGYNCSGALCGGCTNTARGSFRDCNPEPCLIGSRENVMVV
eukprot:SAG22_NODE_1333_length_4674_cov_5.765319_5_plen_213_part_00